MSSELYLRNTQLTLMFEEHKEIRNTKWMKWIISGKQDSSQSNTTSIEEFVKTLNKITIQNLLLDLEYCKNNNIGNESSICKQVYESLNDELKEEYSLNNFISDLNTQNLSPYNVTSSVGKFKIGTSLLFTKNVTNWWGNQKTINKKSMYLVMTLFFYKKTKRSWQSTKEAFWAISDWITTSRSLDKKNIQNLPENIIGHYLVLGKEPKSTPTNTTYFLAKCFIQESGSKIQFEGNVRKFFPTSEVKITPKLGSDKVFRFEFISNSHEIFGEGIVYGQFKMECIRATYTNRRQHTSNEFMGGMVFIPVGNKDTFNQLKPKSSIKIDLELKNIASNIKIPKKAIQLIKDSTIAPIFDDGDWASENEDENNWGFIKAIDFHKGIYHLANLLQNANAQVHYDKFMKYIEGRTGNRKSTRYVVIGVDEMTLRKNHTEYFVSTMWFEDDLCYDYAPKEDPQNYFRNGDGRFVCFPILAGISMAFVVANIFIIACIPFDDKGISDEPLGVSYISYSEGSLRSFSSIAYLEAIEDVVILEDGENYNDYFSNQFPLRGARYVEKDAGTAHLEYLDDNKQQQKVRVKPDFFNNYVRKEYNKNILPTYFPNINVKNRKL